MLDTETDAKLCSNVQDTIVYMLQALGSNNLSHWLQLCKDVLAATTGKLFPNNASNYSMPKSYHSLSQMHSLMTT